MTEEDTYKALYLRFGGLDTSVDPKMSFKDIARLMDKKTATVFYAIDRYIKRGNKYFDLR